MTIRCIAVDDEPLALEKIKGYISKIEYLELLECFSNAADAMSFLRQHKVDLMFLDIQMDELTGIQMLESMAVKPAVILTTAYDEYALKGYELDVSDYLLKPISFQRFLKAVDKVYYEIDKLSMSHDSSDDKDVSKKSPDYLFIKSGHTTVRITIHEILFIEGMKDYLRIWTENEKIMTLMSFKALEEKLPPNSFIRIHKSYLVALDKIDRVERNRIKIGGELLPVGESYRRQFLERIHNERTG
jgi:DNA-binding LytR/AlgR family response regulator